MKRRTFTASLAALFAAPAIPLAAAAPASASLAQHFTTAKLLARCHDRASPQMFARLMKLDADTAHGVFNMLKDRQVIGSGADGIMRALNPLNVNCVPNEAVRLRAVATAGSGLQVNMRSVGNRLAKWLETPPDAAAGDAPETPPESPETQV